MQTELPRPAHAAYFRNFIFGVEDSLVSTVGLLSGVVITGLETRMIFTTGVILVFVEAFSMAVGSFLSEHSAEGYALQAEASQGPAVINGIVMFFSYLFAGCIPLVPYLVWPREEALLYSIGFSLTALFVLGGVGAFLSQLNIAKSGLRMLVVGGIAIGVGILAGRIVNW